MPPIFFAWKKYAKKMVSIQDKHFFATKQLKLIFIQIHIGILVGVHGVLFGILGVLIGVQVFVGVLGVLVGVLGVFCQIKSIDYSRTNKLASLGATLVRNYDRLTHSLTY